MNYIIETERLYIRKIKYSDYKSLCNFLCDDEVMYAWDQGFSSIEVKEWIKENIRRYEFDGFSYYAVIEKNSKKLIGVSGIILEVVDNENYVGIGYIFSKLYWHRGYALESVEGCLNYAFDSLKVKEITAQIREGNISSIKIAQKLGMSPKKEFNKIYKGKKIKHTLYYKVI